MTDDLRRLIPASQKRRHYERYDQDLCLWHDDHKPSLLIWPHYFKCMACGQCGTLADWYAERGEAMPADARGRTRTQTFASAPVERLDPRYVLQCMFRLYTDAGALDYLHGRGLTDQTIERFLLGHNGRRFVIPVVEEGEVVQLKLRADPRYAAEPKYLTQGRGYRLYNRARLAGHRLVVVAEGEFDVMMLDQFGITAVCGTGGVHSFRREWCQAFADARLVCVLFDHDTAGAAAEHKHYLTLEQYLPPGAVLHLCRWPAWMGRGEDATDYFVKYGKSAAEFYDLLRTT